MAEELRVRAARAVAVTGGTREPAFALDVGFRRGPPRAGRVLTRPHLHGGPPARPAHFPCPDFTLVRLPRSGAVVSIRQEAPPLAPGPAVEALRPRFRLRDSELVDGTLEDLPGALARADAARRARPG